MSHRTKCSNRRQPSHFCVDLKDRYICDLLGNLKEFNAPLLSPISAAEIIDTDPNLAFIAGQHSITQFKFETMVGEFFFPSQVPVPEEVIRPAMQALIDAAGTGKIQFEFDELDKNSNDMTLTPIPQIAAVYSAYLFRGILLLNPSTTKFHFYKAIDNGKFTVAIVALNATNNVLYLGELSELYP